MGTPMDRPVMVVTGGSRGIGAATVRAAARQGFAVVVNYSSRADAAEAVVDEVRSHGGRAIGVQADVSDEVAVVAMFERVDAEFGRLDALVNNAGMIGRFGGLAAVEPGWVNRMLAVNVTGAFLCAREAVRRMTSGGAIVNVSSRAGVLGGPGEWVPYAASKGALDTMVAGLSKELGPAGIRVNGVRPGLIDTEIHDAAPPGRLERLVPGVPLGRAGQADEVAEAIVWLCSPAASYVSGAVLDVGGAR